MNCLFSTCSDASLVITPPPHLSLPPLWMLPTPKSSLLLAPSSCHGEGALWGPDRRPELMGRLLSQEPGQVLLLPRDATGAPQGEAVHACGWRNTSLC